MQQYIKSTTLFNHTKDFMLKANKELIERKEQGEIYDLVNIHIPILQQSTYQTLRDKKIYN
ncbi:MAG: hypothetical protein ACLFNM_03380 [Candidatus Woesearchaeota archaeon]